MKAALLTILTLVAGVVYMAQPEKPKYTCKIINKVLAEYCLARVPKYYDAGFLTYLGHTRAWAYRQQNKYGMTLTEKQTKFLSRYSYFEDAVNCHVTASGNANLNMTKTPMEFDNNYKLISGAGLSGQME